MTRVGEVPELRFATKGAGIGVSEATWNVSVAVSPYDKRGTLDGAEVQANFATAARNIPHVDVLPVQGINVYDILRRHNLVLTKAAVDALEARFK